VILALLILLFILLGQLKAPQLLNIIKVPSIKIEGEKSYFFMLHSFVSFVLNVLEYLKIPVMMGIGLLFIDSYLTRNILLSVFLISASFPWDNQFKLKDASFYSIMIGILFNLITLIIIPILWLLLTKLVKEVPRRNLTIVAIILVFSLYTIYFPTIIIALGLQLVYFTNLRKRQERTN